MSARRGAAGIGAAAALVFTAGCGMLGLGGEEPQSDEDRLVEMLNESARIESELIAAEYRIVLNCLEGQGHTVHDQWSVQAWEPYEQDSLTEYYPHEEFLLPPDEAAEYGFGQWANSPDGYEDPASEEYYTAQEEKWQEEEDEGNWEEPDNSEFEALPPEEQYAWYTAYYGEEYTVQSYGTLEEWTEGFSEDYSEEEIIDEEIVEGEDSGELIVEDEESWNEPKPGGCQLEMIEALYGEPTLVEETYEDDGGGSYSYWKYRPDAPQYSDEKLWEDIELGYADRMADLQYEYLDCLEARGYEGWEFTEYNSLPIWEFFAELYYQNASEEEQGWMMSDSDVEVPPIPEDAGDSYEEWKAWEIQAAVDFSECGEEVGYADASEQAYEEVHLEAYSGIEEAVYAWQEEMNDAIKKAQGLLDA